MGQEIQCRVDFGKESSTGKALLETSEVLFRGAFRLKIPFQEIRSMKSGAGKLTIVFSGWSAVFHLGDAAAKWEARIRNPPSRLDKLGVKTGTKVRLIGRHDDDFRRELLERDAVESRSAPEIVFLAIHNKDELVELTYLAEHRVWVIYPKGLETIRESDVRTVGLAVGMVDVKVCAFSATHTALKFTPRIANAQGAKSKKVRNVKSPKVSRASR
ncbi:MAG TPA: hypothetical protein VEV37_07890 [Bryobacteraceae bacterium]|nr:hypothetical protein [Bryobacteraceae bacterium]